MIRSVRATREEQTGPVPGDGLITAPIGSLTHAITIHRPAAEVWPWLTQMGAGRAGWYSVDRIDNGGLRSAERILPALQAIGVGTLFPARPGVTTGFHVLACEPGASLVLGWTSADAEPLVTWAFQLHALDGETTRLVVRARAGRGYPTRGLPRTLGLPLVRVAHAVMQRRQLLGIARRVEQADELLDRFIPGYEVAERHHVSIAAPAAVVFHLAREMDLQDSPLVRAIFTARERLMGARPAPASGATGLVAQVTSLGWGILAEVPDREIVVGCVAQPWLADVVFRALPPDRFASFEEPGYVKIVWTLRADPVGATAAIFRTETRVMPTDSRSSARFRWYWARFSPGIRLIRLVMLRQLKAAAERRLRATPTVAGTAAR